MLFCKAYKKVTGSCSSKPNSTNGLKPLVSYIASLRMTKDKHRDKFYYSKIQYLSGKNRA